MKNDQYYNPHLRRPTWAPPSWLFAPVWTVLYIIIIISYGAVFIGTLQGTIPTIVALPFVLNLFFNLIYTPIQFRLKNNFLGTVDIFLVLGTLIWLVIAIHPYIAWVSYINIPYLLWVSFATVLQVTITYLNA